MTEREPTIRARELGLALSRAARAKGMNGRDLAVRLGWTDAKVSRIFAGKYGVNGEDISAALAALGIVPPKRDELMAMVRHANEPGWWQEYGDRMPPELRTLSDHEDSAIVSTGFETGFVPGLLQADAYMRALIRTSSAIPTDEIDERVEVRKRRQWIFDRGWSTARFTFFLDEYVLRRAGPGRKAMSEQVHHLLRMAVRPNVEIRIVLDSVGFYAGQKPFKLMEFTELHPVVFTETETSALFHERPDTVDCYRRIVAELDRVALNEGHSRAWIASLANELDARREGPDGPQLAEEFFHQPD
jgi:uncharacterized protein DUF5753/helix-turn-helix protein